MRDLQFEFITEDGSQKMTLAEYHTKDALMEKIGLITTSPANRRSVFMGTTILSYPESILASDYKKRSAFEECERIVSENQLKYFVPQNEVVLSLLNDTEHNLKGFIAPNGVGKSVTGCIDVLLDIVPCDPRWPIFTSHGVNFRPYKGPRTLGGVGIVSYEWNNHVTTIWPQIVRRWTPKFALGEWADGGKGVINWRNNPNIEIAGTPVWFFACSQAQTVFEASAMDIYWWDEQGEEDKFNGANMRLRRRNGRHVMTLTPHKVNGRPDTGAGSWIHKLVRRETTAGLNPKFYHCELAGIPDWVYSERAKKEAFREWIEEPTKNNDTKKLREGRSRIYGEFHESSGLVFDDWNPLKHVIEPFNIPKSWPRYRSIDHGRVNPTACLWAAVSPSGDVFLYREYYRRNLTAGENAQEIIKASGNKRRVWESGVDDLGRIVKRYDEVFSAERYRKTCLDSRSMAKKSDESNRTIGQIYRDAGMVVAPADGQKTDKQVVVAKEFFSIDHDREHYVTKESGAPRIYVFSTLVNFIKEIQGYVNEEVVRTDRSGNRSVSERPREKDDHLMTALLYLLMMNLAYIEEVYQDDEEYVDKQEETMIRDEHGGY